MVVNSGLVLETKINNSCFDALALAASLIRNEILSDLPYSGFPR